jgi:HEPN domain-containing protein
MNQEDALRAWKESAERNLAIGKEMIAAGHYDWALFFGQLALPLRLFTILENSQLLLTFR